MVELIIRLFQKFAYEMGILGEIRLYGQFGTICLTVLAVLALLMGLRVYRAVFSLIVFMAIALASSLLLSGKTGWGEIVTCFAVVGTVLAFLAYKWNYLGGAVVCGMIACGLVWTAGGAIWQAVLCTALAVVLAVFFPVISINLITSLWGSCVLTELLPIPEGIWMVLMIAAFGFAIQMFTSRKQDIFQKKYPAAVTHWMEQRKRKQVIC